MINGHGLHGVTVYIPFRLPQLAAKSFHNNYFNEVQNQLKKDFKKTRTIKEAAS